MSKQTINIGVITLEWSDWHSWDDLKADARKKGVVRVPNGIPGVYEAKYKRAKKRLTIGKASDLRWRVKQGLVKGKAKHSAGKNIRKNEDTSRVVVRWAITDKPAAAEEYLHKMHQKRFDERPLYVRFT